MDRSTPLTLSVRLFRDTIHARMCHAPVYETSRLDCIAKLFIEICLMPNIWWESTNVQLIEALREVLRMKFLLGLIIGLLLLPALGYLYVRFGYAPVATAAPPLPFEKQLARMALHARIAAEAPTSAPMQ